LKNKVQFIVKRGGLNLSTMFQNNECHTIYGNYRNYYQHETNLAVALIKKNDS